MGVEGDDARTYAGVFKVEYRDGDGKPRASGAGTARIYVEHSLMGGDVWSVRVPADDGRYAGGCGIEVDEVDVMECVYKDPPDLRRVRGGQGISPDAAIRVASHRDDRRDFPQAFQYLRASHIARMHDHGDAVEDIKDLRP